MRTSGAAGGPSDVQGVRDKYFLEPSVSIALRWEEHGLTDEERTAVTEVYRLRPDEPPCPALAKAGPFSFSGLFTDAKAGDRDVFINAFEPMMPPMVSAAFAWRPTDGVTKVVVMLTHMPSGEGTARVAMFDNKGACFVGMSADGRPPRALHDAVGALWSDFCTAHPTNLPFVLTITCKLGNASAGGQASATYDLQGIWHPQDMSQADKRHVSLLYGLPYMEDVPPAKVSV